MFDRHRVGRHGIFCDICVEREEGGASWRCNCWRKRNIRGGFVDHGVCGVDVYLYEDVLLGDFVVG